VVEVEFDMVVLLSWFGFLRQQEGRGSALVYRSWLWSWDRLLLLLLLLSRLDKVNDLGGISVFKSGQFVASGFALGVGTNWTYTAQRGLVLGLGRV
jgi:hypothetical protein